MSKHIEVAFVPGDLVYTVRDGVVFEGVIEFIYVAARTRYHAKTESFKFNFRVHGIGRDVFYTREDAEAKLADMQRKGSGKL